VYPVILALLLALPASEPEQLDFEPMVLSHTFEFRGLLGERNPEQDSWSPWVNRAEPASLLTARSPTERVLMPAWVVVGERERESTAPDIPELSENRRADVWGDISQQRQSGWQKRIQIYNAGWARSRAKLELPDLADLSSPYLAQHWKAEEMLSVPVIDDLFLFGKLNGKGNTVLNQQARVVTKTGLGYKWAPALGTELIFRGGPMVTYGDADIPNTGFQRSQLAIEVIAETPVYKSLRVEYVGTALPALLPIERDQLSTDLRLAVPLGRDGEFHFGATYRWENTLTPTPWADRAQLYFGIEFRH